MFHWLGIVGGLNLSSTPMIWNYNMKVVILVTSFLKKARVTGSQLHVIDSISIFLWSVLPVYLPFPTALAGEGKVYRQ